jgi:hypothetical protein
MKSEQPPTDQCFPRIYRVDARTRRAVNALSIALAGFVLFLTVLQLAWHASRRTSLGDLIFVDLAVGAALAWLGSSNNKRVILHRDGIEVAGWFYSRKLRFAEIRGRQTTGSSRLPFGYAHIFVPSDSRKRKLALPLYLHTDQIFRDWIKTVPKVPR